MCRRRIRSDMNGGTGPTVRATEISLETINAIRALDGARLTEIAERLDLAKSTVHRHLNTLESNGYVVREGNEYQIGLKFLHFGEYARNREGVYRPAEEQVQRLARATNEEVDFTVEEHGRLISLYHSVGQSKRSGLQVGSYFSMHNTAAGKAMLSELPDDRVEAILDRWGLPGKTSRTITDREALLADLDATRERGYAVNDEELLEGFRSIGAAITGPDGSVIGGLSVGGPTYRIDIENPGDLLESMHGAVADLEAEIESGSRSRNNWWEQYSPID